MTSAAKDIELLNKASEVANELSEAENGVRKNGAVITGIDGNIIAKGANRTPGPLDLAGHQVCRTAKTQDKEWIYYLLEHAERDAISDAYRHGHNPSGGTMYCTLFPCADCARAIVAAGIKRIVVRFSNSDEEKARNEKWKVHFNYSKMIFECSGVTVDWVNEEQLAGSSTSKPVLAG